MVWGVTNASGENTPVTCKDFLRKKHVGNPEGDPHNPVTPFVWLFSDTLGARQWRIRGDRWNSPNYDARIKSSAFRTPSA